MRLGEVLGLSWSDIDFAAKKITVRRQLYYLNRSGYFLSPPKTAMSERYIIADDYLLEELQRWKSRQVENEKQFGDSYFYVYRKSDGHIIRQSKGLPAPDGEKVSLLCTKNDGRIILRALVVNMLKAESLNAHSFRHTHATKLTGSGVTAKAVAGRLGHANTSVTQNLYTHNTLKLQEEAAVAFNKFLQAKP